MAARLVIILGTIQVIVLGACTETEFRTTTASVTPDTTYARLLLEEARRLEVNAAYDSAMVFFDLASAQYDSARDWSSVLYCRIGSGKCAAKLGRLEEAGQIFDAALAIGMQHLSKSDPAIAYALSEIGWLYMREGRYPLSMELLQKALKSRIATFGVAHASVADSYNRLAFINYLSGNYDRAEALYGEALRIQNELSSDEPSQTRLIYTNLGLLYRDAGKYAQAIECFEKALSIEHSSTREDYLDVAVALKNLGEAHRLQGNYELAFKAHYDALEIAERFAGKDSRAVANVLNDLAIVYSNTGNSEQAILFFRRSLQAIRTILGNQHHEVATRLSGLGIEYRTIGDYYLALRYLHSALRIRQNKLSDDDRVVGIYFNNIGSVYAQMGDFYQARDYYEQALAAFLGSLGELHPYVANQYKKLGGVKNRLGAHHEALLHLEKSLQIFRATSGEHDPYVATVYSALGSVYDSLGATDRALEFQRLSLHHLLETHGQHHPEVATRYNEIGDIYRREGEYGLALANYKQALNANRPRQSEGSAALHRDGAQSLSDSDRLVSLWGIARTLSARSSSSSSGVSDLEGALDTYRDAAATLDRMQRQYRNQSSRLHWVEVAAPLMSDAVDVSFALYEATGDERYKSAAFYFAEKSKGSVLLGALTDARARRFAGIPDSLLRQERSLLSSLVSAEQRIMNVRTDGDESVSTDLGRLEQEAFSLTQQHAALIDHIETSYPNYYRLKYNVEVMTPERLQATGIDDETALVEYMIGDEQVFIFTVSTSDFDVTAVPRSRHLEQQVEDLRRGIVEQDYQAFTANAWALYVQLLEPVIHTLHARNLIIVPDGVLNYVPFESLLTTAPTSSTRSGYGQLPYLIKRYAVSYAYSSTLLTETRDRKRLEPDRDFIAFAPVASNGLLTGSPGADLLEKYTPSKPTHAAGWGYLPMTRVEVTKIKELFARTYNLYERFFSDKAQVYLGRDARESLVMSDDVSRYRYVHFATHGFADPTAPESSGIVLFSTPRETGSEDSTSFAVGESAWSEDGVLRLDEVYALHLNADVVVLSACETGVGRVARGEGILSLARGFLYAGASNVVASLWKADDLQTQRLMLGFYGNMLKKYSTSASLRDAKLDLIRGNARYARPYYWATFVLIGS